MLYIPLVLNLIVYIVNNLAYFYLLCHKMDIQDSMLQIIYSLVSF